MTIKARLHFTLEYLMAFVLSCLLHLFIDGDAGLVFMAVLGVVPIYSLAMAFFSKTPYKVEISLSDNSLNKGDSVEVAVSVGEPSRFSAPFICVDLVTEGGFGQKRQTLVIPMMKACATAAVSLSAERCGCTEIRAENVRTTGLFGIASFKTGSLPCSCELCVYPDRLSLPTSTPLLAQINAASSFDDSEETADVKTATAGVPGYEHREYTDGDSPKRVNWKLSAKRDKLFVRLDEAAAKSKVSLVLSAKASASSEADDLLFEGLLAFADRLSELDNRCVLHYRHKENQLQTPIETHSDVEQLRTILSQISFVPAEKTVGIIPFDEIAEAKATAMVVLFTATFGEAEEAALQACESRGYETAVITAAQPTLPTGRAVWCLKRADGAVWVEM